jgi:hypothetical protein
VDIAKYVAIALLLLLLVGIGLRLQDEDQLVMVISQNGEAVASLDQARNITNSTVLPISTVDFPHGMVLRYNGSELPYHENFFMDMTMTLHVQRAGNYTFTVHSDDGFRLRVDNKTVSEHTGIRPAGTNTDTTYLSAGKHLLRLTYFNGPWHSYLQVTYKGNSIERLLGNSSDEILFS